MERLERTDHVLGLIHITYTRGEFNREIRSVCSKRSKVVKTLEKRVRTIAMAEKTDPTPEQIAAACLPLFQSAAL